MQTLAFTLEEIACQYRVVNTEMTRSDLYFRKITGAVLRIH